MPAEVEAGVDGVGGVGGVGGVPAGVSTGNGGCWLITGGIVAGVGVAVGAVRGGAGVVLGVLSLS